MSLIETEFPVNFGLGPWANGIISINKFLETFLVSYFILVYNRDSYKIN